MRRALVSLFLLPFLTAPAFAKPEDGLAREQIKAVVDKGSSQVRDCYEKALSRDPYIQGTISFLFFIGADGQVIKSSIQKTDIEDAEVKACVHEVLKKWQFPKPTGGKTVEVLYPFVLRKVQ